MELRVGCSGWFYEHWSGLFYPENLPKRLWFQHYASKFDTVELNSPFYHWPKPFTIQAWADAAPEGFRFSIKVNRLITHLKRLRGTTDLVREFCDSFTSILGKRMGCFLFQLPPSIEYSPAQLKTILRQVSPGSCVEFRHASWWSKEVFDAFQDAGLVFCSVSGMDMPDQLVQTSDALYLRLHGPAEAYAGSYPRQQLLGWAKRLKETEAKTAWVYFNNDWEAHAVKNAISLRALLKRSPQSRS